MNELPKDMITEIIIQINDPITFQYFCMTCQLFWKIGRKYIELKKKQFSKLINISTCSCHYTIYYRLPNKWINGLHRTYFNNGQIHKEINYLNDKRNGLFTVYHPNGHISSSFTGYLIC